jgi:diguanylate cyclase (GGDEF)-like protein
MFPKSMLHRWKYVGWALLAALLTGTAVAAVPVHETPEQLLKEADSLKTSDYLKSVAIVRQLGDGAVKLSPEQQLYRSYLEAWQISYGGNFEAALPLLNTVVDQSKDATLRFRAGLLVVNLLSLAHHSAEAFARINPLLDQLPQITDKVARIQALDVAALLADEAGQYNLGLGYANQLLSENPGDKGNCKGRYYRIEALYEDGKLQDGDKEFKDGIDACNKAAESLYANGVRFYLASFDLQHGRNATAIALLRANYAGALSSNYAWLISGFDALLAQAYWKEGEVALAKQFALAAVEGGVRNEFTKPLVGAYQVLYLVDKKQGNLAEALAYHEKYMDADKGYLNGVSAKALAYQMVKQQVQTKKQQIDSLNKQNQILHLQQSLDKKAAEASRLYIVLLLTVLAFIAFWTYRIKRSQLRFMKLARRDGLTGIFNRQHFVTSAELQLQYCKKSARHACVVLIDLDHFKVVNDTHGHAVGDRVLKRAVEACERHLRSTDIFGRLGGEEFGIVLPECTLDQALNRAEQIRVAIATTAIGDDTNGVLISASFGVATIARSGYELRQLLIHADDGLYLAKREGRNRVCVCYDAQPRQRVAGVATERA